MARPSKIWFWEDRKAYFVTIRGLRHNLGPDKAEASRQFHALMSGVAAPTPAPAGVSVASLLDQYLAWLQAERSTRTYEWTLWHAQSFCGHLKSAADPEAMPAAMLRPHHLVAWSHARPTWGANQRRGAISCIQRAFAWAARLGLIDRDPVAGTQKPAPTRREHHTTPEAFASLLANYPEGDPFRDYLEFLWETGCRPLEARQLEPRHYSADRGLFALPPEEAKGKRKWRLIRLTAKAREIAERRIAGGGERVFENEDGRPWTGDAVNCRFQRLKRAGKCSEFAYGLRHGFAQRKLEAGVDHLTVAELMGHADGAMIAKVYSHLHGAEEHLRKALGE